jgi:hypothetical protein
MTKVSTWIKLVLVVLLGIFIQVLLILADFKDTPHKAVVEFTKAYFMLDHSMSKRLCNEMAAAESDVVDRYIQLVTKEAGDRGLGVNCLKSKLYNIKTRIISKNDTMAKIRIKGDRRVAINPLYAVIAKMFNIGGTYKVYEIINVVKENDKWKICGDAFSLQS